MVSFWFFQLIRDLWIPECGAVYGSSIHSGRPAVSRCNALQLDWWHPALDGFALRVIPIESSCMAKFGTFHDHAPVTQVNMAFMDSLGLSRVVKHIYIYIYTCICFAVCMQDFEKVQNDPKHDKWDLDNHPEPTRIQNDWYSSYCNIGEQKVRQTWNHPS